MIEAGHRLKQWTGIDPGQECSEEMSLKRAKSTAGSRAKRILSTEFFHNLWKTVEKIEIAVQNLGESLCKTELCSIAAIA